MSTDQSATSVATAQAGGDFTLRTAEPVLVFQDTFQGHCFRLVTVERPHQDGDGIQVDANLLVELPTGWSNVLDEVANGFAIPPFPLFRWAAAKAFQAGLVKGWNQAQGGQRAIPGLLAMGDAIQCGVCGQTVWRFNDASGARHLFDRDGLPHPGHPGTAE
jgi:hypothetical protein